MTTIDHEMLVSRPHLSQAGLGRKRNNYLSSSLSVLWPFLYADFEKVVFSEMARQARGHHLLDDFGQETYIRYRSVTCDTVYTLRRFLKDLTRLM